MKEIPFVKMHGLGNDFLIMELNATLNFSKMLSLVSQMSHRKTGLGCDQLILYKKITNTLYEMFIYNQDSSPAKACGNASRCVAKLITAQNKEDHLRLMVGDRINECVIYGDLVQVNMGHPVLNAPWMPTQDQLWNFATRYGIDSKDIMCVEMGNPHLVIFGINDENDQELIGKVLQNSELFPGGVNVNFANIIGDKIYLRVWERGTGITLSCGSGACATFVAAKHNGYISEKSEVVFELGSLSMEMLEGDIIMTGPAVMSAKGIYYYD